MNDDIKDDVKNDEEQIVKDNDANTGDIVKEENNDYSRMLDFMEEMRARMDAMDASIRSIKDAQSITIDNGAIIRDDSPQVEDDNYVDTRTIPELDLSI